jgi:SAM-dependent methyltransferase
MQNDIRAEAAQYYDTNLVIPDDIAFYQARLPWSDASVLELGCGTGRVLLPLAASCGFIHGIDRSQAMLARCRQKLQAAEQVILEPGFRIVQPWGGICWGVLWGGTGARGVVW